jgi:hypothetical protein
VRERVRRGLQHIARAAIDHRQSLAIGSGVFVAAAVAFLWARRSARFWTIDDAGITFAAALAWADHGSFAANVEGTPVESYSNPLVFFVAALLRWLGAFDPVVTHLRLEMLLFALMAVLVWAMVRRLAGDVAAVLGAALFTTVQLTAPATWLWYGSGLENVWVSAGLVALVWICVRTARGVALAPAWGAVAFLTALTRPEAPIYVAGFYIALAVCARPPELPLRAHVRQVALALAVTTVLYVAFLAWRRLVYEDWLPNTYYAKMFGPPDLGHNLRVSVIKNILPYSRAWLLASSALVLLLVPRHARIAASLLVMLVASLALPLGAGEDWAMGERRFATPFLAMCHVAFAMFAGVCVAKLASAARVWRVAALAGLLVVALLTYKLVDKRLDHPVKVDPLTIALIGESQGGARWEHQMRLGVPFGVTMIPDAGGSLIVGGMQMIDNAYLADFVLAHMGRYFGDPALLRQLNQYTHEERSPDLVDSSTAIGAIDTAYIGTRYLPGPDHLHARRDLVVVAAIEPGARPLFDDGRLQVYVSSETEPTAAPGGLVRCELIVAWSGAPVGDIRIRGAIDGGERDELSLRPYQAGTTGTERRALLLGAPRRAGAAAATIEIVRGDDVLAREQAFAVEVRSDDAALAGAAQRILADASTMRAARRLAWLREQQVPRLGMTSFRRVLRELADRDRRHGSLIGESLLALRWNARLASFERVPAAIRTAEVAIARRLVAACPPGAGPSGAPSEPGASGAPPATRVACVGRAIDELRRLGYLGMVGRLPEVASELARAAGSLGSLPPEPRYQALVGLTLADPADIARQRELIALRRDLLRYPELPAVTDRRPSP